MKRKFSTFKIFKSNIFYVSIFCKALRHVSLYGYTKLMMYRDGCAGRNVPLVVVDRQKELLQSGGGSFQPDVVSSWRAAHDLSLLPLKGNDFISDSTRALHWVHWPKTDQLWRNWMIVAEWSSGARDSLKSVTKWLQVMRCRITCPRDSHPSEHPMHQNVKEIFLTGNARYRLTTRASNLKILRVPGE